MYNKVILIGRLGSNIELKHNGNRDYATFSLATNKFKAQGEEVTSWHDCLISYPRTLERAEKMLKKGVLVQVEGELYYWMMNVNDVQVKKASIIVYQFVVLESMKSKEEFKQPSIPKEIKQELGLKNDLGVEDDDLPF